MAAPRAKRRRCTGCGRLADVLSVRFVEDFRGKVHRLVRCEECWERREQWGKEREVPAR